MIATDKSPVKVGSSPYLTANFAPVIEENTITELQVTGTIPEELTGRFLRIGPNPAVQPPKNYHWFLGTGMVHGLRVHQGKAEWYRNSFVLTDNAAHDLKRKPLPSPRKTRGGSVNTNVLRIGGDLYALVEAGGLPVKLDYNLQSLENSDFGGTLKGGFSAHPRLDPVTGELHVLAYEPGKTSIDYLVVDQGGYARRSAQIAAPHQPMIHDTAITKSFVIVLDLPVTFDLLTAMTGKFPYIWNRKQQSRIGLLPRGDGANNAGGAGVIKWFETPVTYVYHILNAFEDGDQVIVDVVKNTTSFDADILKRTLKAPQLVRWILNLSTGKLSETLLCDQPVEFPRLNDAFVGRDYRYGYTAEFTTELKFGRAYKHDLLTRKTLIHDYGAGRMTMEPVFIPKQKNARPDSVSTIAQQTDNVVYENEKENDEYEDEGWIMSYVFDENTNKTDVVILDAQDFEGEPVATIHLPVRVPFGFHGNWVPDDQSLIIS